MKYTTIYYTSVPSKLTPLVILLHVDLAGVHVRPAHKKHLLTNQLFYD